MTHDPLMPKKLVNWSSDADLSPQDRALKEERWRRWQEENREGIEAHNRFVETRGLFNDIRKRL